jgi:hypothetical protein
VERIIFGDNQFFGINHMSEEKARQQALRFQDLEAIVEVLEDARDLGISAFMCTTHDRVAQIADRVRKEPADWDGFRFYPCMPYAHKYANAVTELGYVDTVRKFLPREGLVDAVVRGSKALLTNDIESVITLLIDAEMKMFERLETPVVFLQNVVTDLVLGLNAVSAFRVFADHVRTRYRAEPGFITMNLPMLLPKLAEAGIDNPIVCANVNSIGFRMSGGIEAYREAAAAHPARVIAMSVFASGALPAREALRWVLAEPYVQSIVFGASSRRNISNTVELVRELSRTGAPA